jgi:hypothetical protein
LSSSGQIAQTGAQITLNKLCGLEVPYVGTSQTAFLAAWVPGQYWVNTNFTPPQIYGTPDGVTTPTAVAAAGSNRFLALLTINPGGVPATLTVPATPPVTTVAGLTEVTTAGYARAPVQFEPASAAYPSVTYNTNLATFCASPTYVFTTQMLIPAQWVALVTSASGSTGSLLYWWELPEPILAPAQQPVQVPIGNLIPGNGLGLTLDQA